jgi:hypothetical protein
MNLYDEMPWIEQHFQAVQRAAPHAKVVVVDGAYEKYPHPEGEPQSTDGTLEFARENAHLVVECPYPDGWPSEEVKRSAYFVGEDGDEYFVVDGDEEVVGVVPTAVEAQDAMILLMRDDSSAMTRCFRYHKHGPEMRYHGHHNSLWRGKARVRKQLCPDLKGFYLLHRWTIRGRERQKRKSKYYRWMIARERNYRSCIGD